MATGPAPHAQPPKLTPTARTPARASTTSPPASGTPRAREHTLPCQWLHYLLQELQDTVPLPGQVLGLLGTLQPDLGSLGIQGSHPLLGAGVGMSWLPVSCGTQPGPAALSFPTFLRAMLRWHSARLCRSCCPRASRSSSRRLSHSSCWNSRSSNSLASVSSTSASCRHTRAQWVTLSGQASYNETS